MTQQDLLTDTDWQAAFATSTLTPPAPGRVLPGHRVACYGGLPGGYAPIEARVVAVGPQYTRVRVHGDPIARRVPNDLVKLSYVDPIAHAWPRDPRDADAHPHRGRYTHPVTGRWLPHWSWIGWTVAEHLEYRAGRRPLLGRPELAPRRLVIVGCGGRKEPRLSDAHAMYTGSYHLACRRAADALTASGGDWIILSALYGLLYPHDVIERYDLRMGQPGSVAAETIAYQAQQLGLAEADEVIVLAGRAYADIVSAVWPHAIRPLDGTASMGEQLSRLAAIAADTA